jgi:hypothetical protein
VTVTGQPAGDAQATPFAGAAPWTEWIGDAVENGAALTHSQWLAELEKTLAAHVADSHYEETRLSALWEHMKPKLAEFLPQEVAHVIDEQRAAAARRGAAEALLLLVRLDRHQAGGEALPAVVPAHALEDGGVDSVTLSRLLDSFTADRAATGRSVVAQVLETLCSITLDLEVSERRMGGNGGRMHDTLSDLRNHVSEAAIMLRALPNSMKVHTETGEQLAVAVSRCVGRYAGSMDAHLEWFGGDPLRADTAGALVWLLEDLLHHLYQSVAGSASITVTVDNAQTTLTVRTPSNAFAAGDAEPDWLLRSRLRAQLAGGEIRAGDSAPGSAVEVWLP